MSITQRDLKWMRLAISEARRSVHKDGRGAHPDVGAVAVCDNQIVGSACHGDLYPCDHAEFTLLEKKLQKHPLAGCTVYTTLEPCVERGAGKKPCAQRLIRRRVSRVVIGMLDPNQTVTGKGILQLRRAGIAVDLFPPELMAELEELNRDFIDDQESSISHSALAGVTEAGMTAFYPSRDYYSRFRHGVGNIDQYVATAQHTAILISINLMTGIPFNDLCGCLQSKLTKRGSKFSVVISLLDPRCKEVMMTIAPVLKMQPGDLAGSIHRSLKELLEFKARLPEPARRRFKVQIHTVLPFGSAIMLDHQSPSGRIQIESKPYKAALQQSFAFEIKPGGKSGFYEVIAKAYEDILRDGEDAESLNWPTTSEMKSDA
jgi:pyrimidine deaminase RibD-like protein